MEERERMEQERFRGEMPWEKKERKELEKEMRREEKRLRRRRKCGEEDSGAPLLQIVEKDGIEEKGRRHKNISHSLLMRQ